jgi:hypothetical protein
LNGVVWTAWLNGVVWTAWLNGGVVGSGGVRGRRVAGGVGIR